LDENIPISEKQLARINARIELAERYVPEQLLTAAAVQLITEDAPAMTAEIARLRSMEDFSVRVVEFIRARGLGRELSRFLSREQEATAPARLPVAAAGD
jgi:hypothetical protein